MLHRFRHNTFSSEWSLFEPGDEFRTNRSFLARMQMYIPKTGHITVQSRIARGPKGVGDSKERTK